MKQFHKKTKKNLDSGNLFKNYFYSSLEKALVFLSDEGSVITITLRIKRAETAFVLGLKHSLIKDKNFFSSKVLLH